MSEDMESAKQLAFNRAYERLHPKYKDIIYQIHVKKERQSDIARRLGVSRQRVNNLKRRAEELLNEYYYKELNNENNRIK